MKLPPQIHKFLSNISNKCLKVFCQKPLPPTKNIEISAPFNLTEGPAIHFPGYSEDDISLMREKALASTAVVEEGRFEISTGRVVPRTRGGSFSYGFEKQVANHGRRFSRG
ncbi:hypothetical protein BUE80_DR000959, partial [Diplocarpon rosae]